MKQFTFFLLMAVFGFSLTSPAFSADDGWYVLGGSGKIAGKNDKSAIDTSLNKIGFTGFSSAYVDPIVYKLHAGYQIAKNIAVEGGYIGSNSATYTASGGTLPANYALSGKISGVTIVALASLPVADKLSVLGKLGASSIKESASYSNGRSASASTTDFAYGAGVRYNFTDAIFGRLDLDSYKSGSSSATFRRAYWTIGAGYKF
jgi:OOP family OmpA-OmpF porin